jgi:hypothetical protein
MKVRNGFVSNSSSSSFCIFGTCIELDEMVEKFKQTKFLTDEEFEEFEESDEWGEVAELIEEKTNLVLYQNDDTFWIGRRWQDIQDDETGGDFKKNVETELEKILGVSECYTYEEEIYG